MYVSSGALTRQFHVLGFDTGEAKARGAAHVTAEQSRFVTQDARSSRQAREGTHKVRKLVSGHTRWRSLWKCMKKHGAAACNRSFLACKVAYVMALCARLPSRHILVTCATPWQGLMICSSRKQFTLTTVRKWCRRNRLTSCLLHLHNALSLDAPLGIWYLFKCECLTTTASFQKSLNHERQGGITGPLNRWDHWTGVTNVKVSFVVRDIV